MLHPVSGSATDSARVEYGASQYDYIDLDAIIRKCRLTVCEAYYSGGHPAALAALACSSIRLYRYVDEGTLIGHFAYDALGDVAKHLTLTRVLGSDIVAHAIDAGPQFYSSLPEFRSLAGAA